MTEPVQITEVPDEVVEVIEETPLTVLVEETEGETIVIQESPEDSEVIISIPGPPGEPGPQGPPGPVLTLEGFALFFAYPQDVPSDVWTVNHNLGRRPAAVSIIDSAGSEIEGEVQHTSINQLVARFSVPFSGVVLCT